MKRTRGTTITGAVILVLGVIVFSVIQIVDPGRRTTVYTVSVIVEDSSSNRWRSFREGLNQAAADENIILNIVSTGEFDRLSDVTDIIRREQTNGTDGLIVYPAMYDTSDTLSGLLASTPAVLAGTSLSGQNRVDAVAPDGYELGRTVAELLLKYGQPDSSTAIGVLSGNQRTQMMQECLDGFTETLGSYADRIQWTLSQQALNSGNLLGVSVEAKTVDILIALDNQAMETAAEFLTQNPKYSCRLYGEGRSEECIYFLDQGVIGALAVPDEFMMGYESMALLLEKMSLYSPTARNTEIEILSVTRENLFDEETAGTLFPTVS